MAPNFGRVTAQKKCAIKKKIVAVEVLKKKPANRKPLDWLGQLKPSPCQDTAH